MPLHSQTSKCSAGIISQLGLERYQGLELISELKSQQVFGGFWLITSPCITHRQVLAVAYAQRESQSSWKEFLLGLKKRGLSGVRLVVSDDHPGLKAAIKEVLPEAWWQRCYVHFLRNALDHLTEAGFVGG